VTQPASTRNYLKELMPIIRDIVYVDGPIKLLALIDTVEACHPKYRCAGCYNGVKPIQSTILHMLAASELVLTPDRLLKLPA
jgi:hypothetical protein